MHLSCKNALMSCTSHVPMMIKETASGYKSCKVLHVACYASLKEYIIQFSVAVH